MNYVNDGPGILDFGPSVLSVNLRGTDTVLFFLESFFSTVGFVNAWHYECAVEKI